MKYAEVLLPTVKNPNAKSGYSYSIPPELKDQLQIGQLVSVPFGKQEKTAIIISFTDQKPSFATKPIGNIIIDMPLLSQPDLAIIKQTSEYYLSTPHRVCKLYIPKKMLTDKWEPKLDKEDNIRLSSFLRKLSTTEDTKLHTPTDEQAAIIKNISPHIINKKHNIHLLLGPTGSGKTEVYLHLMNQLKEKQQALLLVPEIALTPQLAQYFFNHFGQKIEVWHSELNDTEKKNAWWRIRNQEAKVIIGSRSSLFMPFQDLGLIIVDEEQAHAFKQEQIPRYHGRTVAQWLSSQHSCPLILGTATPSLETYQASLNNRIQFHQLTKRIHNTPLPKIQIVDIKDEIKKRNYSPISEPLQEKIAETLANKRQILLFLNRRGFASSLQCFECGNVESCNNCDISLTIHQASTGQFLQCHLCGQTYPTPSACRSCKSRKIKNIGLGTQQVETEINQLFPEARVLRADRDTTKKKHSFQDMYEKFRNHEADILIGTQMISKGLHLPKVDLVGIMLADIGLHIPDFRATEKAFQLLTQVCGRAGRSQTQGHVIIQTLSPNHAVLQSITDNNLPEFYTKELLIRQHHDYPPFRKLTKLTYVDPNQSNCIATTKKIEQKLIQKGIVHLSAPALVFRQYNKYHYNILLFSNSPEDIIEQLSLDHNWRIDRDPLETS